MRILKTFTLLALIALGQAACGATIPREEVLECGLPDGSKFVLRAKYDWDPMAQFLPHATERYNKQNFKVSFYGKKKFQRAIDVPIETIEHTRLGSSAVAKGLCSEFSLIRGNAAVYQYIVFGGRNKATEINTDSLKGVSQTLTENTPSIQNELHLRGLEPLYETSFFGFINGRYVHEQGLAATGQKCDARPADEQQCSIIAVSRNISTENGNTWVGPVIASTAEIFELGKSLREQSFLARPLRVNGKSFIRIEQEEARVKAKEAKSERASNEFFRKKNQKASQEYAKTLDSTIVSRDFARFEQLINAGASIDAATKSPYRQDTPAAPLLIALDKPETAPFAVALINRGANLNPKGIPPGVNVLMLAAGYSTPEVMKTLLAKQKFYVNQRNPNGATALSYAVASGRIDNARLLLELGADPQVKTSEGGLLDIARLQGYTEIVKLLEQRQ